MRKFSIIGAAFALTLSATAFAQDMACCKDKADCCKEQDGKRSCCDHAKHAQEGGHAGHAGQGGHAGDGGHAGHAGPGGDPAHAGHDMSAKPKS
jgi:hypothetical protein